MRLRIALLVAALLVPAGASLATAADGSAPSSTAPRRAVQTYRGAAGVSASLPSVPSAVPDSGSWVALRPRENRVVLTAKDDASQRVLLRVEFLPREARAARTVDTCGSTVTLDVAAGSRLRVRPLVGRCTDGSLSTPTSGTISFRFFAPPVVRVVPPARRWALLIGLKTYQRPTHDTVGGDRDTAAVRSALLHAGWRSDHIRTISSSQGTAAGIAAGMRWLVARSSNDTFTLLHYSGHVCIASRGPCPSGHTYLWGTDNRFVSEASVASILRGLRGSSWLDFAGCEAAAFDAGLHSPRRLVTASSQPHETSYERPDWGQSVWAGLLWDRGYLRGQASPSGRPYSATVDQMLRFATEQATATTASQPAGAQHPYHAGGGAGWRLSAPPG